MLEPTFLKNQLQTKGITEMKKTVLLIGLLATSLFLTPQAEAKGKAEKEIRALEDRLMAAFKAKDLDGVMANYAGDDSLFVFDVIPPRQYVGAKAYRKDFEDFFALVSGDIIASEISDLSIIASGKIAFSHSVQHIAWTGKDGKKWDVTIRVTDGYRKIDGKWLIVQEHVSVPVNPDTSIGDWTSKP
jgi:uncharacterized protein (TIGR02246 family)